MNFRGTGKQITPRVSSLLSQFLSRGTSKIAVEVDGNVLTRLEQNDMKHRQHPGIVRSNRLELPSNIQKALRKAIGDQPVKSLVSDCKRLNQYIRARHPPPEQDEFRTKMRQVVDEIDQQMPPGQIEVLSEEEGANWRRRRELAIKRVMGQRTYAWKPITYGAYESLVYALGRGAQEYGVLLRILRELQQRDPSFQPRSYIDFGSGVGTGMWAASHFWKDSIFEYYNVDSSRDMNDLSELILRDGNENQQITLKNVYYRQFLPGLDTKYDLVVSSYSFFELKSAEERSEVLLNLWRKCDGYLIIVEEGTRRGSELINEAREYLLGLNDVGDLQGHVFAPCPHDSICPRHADDSDSTPCNFEVSYTPLKIGDINADHLTARYSYLVMKKGSTVDATQHWPRLVRPTLARSGHTICRMCTADAKLQEVIVTASKHGKAALRCAKVSRWGDRLPFAIGGVIENKTTTATRIKEEKLKNESQIEEN